MKKIFFCFIILFILIPVFVFADCDKVGLDCAAEENFTNADVSVFVGNIIRAVLSILGVMVLIYMVYGGYLWMMSGGNDQMVKKAKDILINATIGLIIVIAAYAITAFVVGGIYSASISSSGSSSAEPCLSAPNNFCTIYGLSNGDPCSVSSSLPSSDPNYCSPFAGTCNIESCE